jgi:hypothetical protein
MNRSWLINLNNFISDCKTILVVYLYKDVLGKKRLILDASPEFRVLFVVLLVAFRG